MAAPEDLLNQALLQIGWQGKPIADIYEGSKQSRAGLEIYGETRDEVLAQRDWPFALREVALAASGQIPPSPWANEFTYPSDCLRVRGVRPGPLVPTGTPAREFDPQPVLWRPWNDNRPTTPIRAILCDLSVAVLIYTGRVTSPVTWEPEYTRTLVDRLAMKLAFKLAGNENLVKARIGLAQMPEAATDLMAPMMTQMPAEGARGQ